MKKLEPCSNVNFLKQAKNIDTLRNLGIDLEENAPIKFFNWINKQNDIDLVTIENIVFQKKSCCNVKRNNMSYLDEKH